jgi:predicted RNA-binding Zn-ribbon protein involved in translation (DUF1610 family)
MTIIRKGNIEVVWLYLLGACVWGGMYFMVADTLGWLGLANRAAILSEKPNLIGGIVFAVTFFPSIKLVLHVIKTAEETAMLKPFAPERLRADASRSGFFQCPECGLVWFGRPDIKTCPGGPHGDPVSVAFLCRTCDAVISADQLVEHLCAESHVQHAKNSN